MSTVTNTLDEAIPAQIHASTHVVPYINRTSPSQPVQPHEETKHTVSFQMTTSPPPAPVQTPMQPIQQWQPNGIIPPTNQYAAWPKFD
eukprot:10981499-Ditylum_brightwellii.AAC.1